MATEPDKFTLTLEGLQVPRRITPVRAVISLVRHQVSLSHLEVACNGVVD